MFDQTEAKSIADAYLDNAGKGFLDATLDLVKRAASEGKYEVCADGVFAQLSNTVKPLLKKHLEARGFRVDQAFSQRDVGESWKISWAVDQRSVSSNYWHDR